ncbi:hypothetical protein C7271_20100 [filamentous cyanobacterium CCP5]|nr:hypothetical protein C7271_20100 [filamentous cyanobacterium CCP5]
MTAKFRRWGLAVAIGLWICCAGGQVAMAHPLTTLASIHTYHERPAQTTYRSRLTLPDRDDRAWQATLFHRYVGGEDQGILLRLVAFPGSARVAPSGHLRVSTGTGLEWQVPANDATLPANRPDNIGQYAFDQVLADLQAPIPLTLDVPLASGRTQQLVVAPYVVVEWQVLAAMAAPTHSYSPDG